MVMGTVVDMRAIMVACVATAMVEGYGYGLGHAHGFCVGFDMKVIVGLL